MKAKLDDLIEKIRQEGVEDGERTSADIVEKARQEAAAIVARARQEAEKATGDAKAQAARFQENAERAMQQAARDVELLLKERISDLFGRAFRHQVSAALTPDFMAATIGKLISAWAAEGGVEVTVSDADKQALQALLFAQLKEELKGSVNLRVSNFVASGFRLELKGESAYYDFTDETIADALKAFINPSLQAILDGRDG